MEGGDTHGWEGVVDVRLYVGWEEEEEEQQQQQQQQQQQELRS